MSTQQLINIDPSAIPALLAKLDVIFKKDGIIVPVDADDIKDLDFIELRLYCHYNCIYQIITTELVEWFKNNITLTNTIEIGSGVGTLGRALGIRMTDNHQQNKPEMKMIYMLSGQPTINYGTDVEEIDAISAIKKYKPSKVIGSWITHKYNAEEHHLGGNADGVDELKLIQLVDTYYMVGNLNIHFNNLLLNNTDIVCNLIHEPYLFSRNQEKKKNFIFEFYKNGC